MATPLSEPLTRRLVLRQWRDEDRTPFAALNADPLVMEHFPALLTRDQSDALMDRCIERIQGDGYGLWGRVMPPRPQTLYWQQLSVLAGSMKWSPSRRPATYARSE